MAGSEGRRTVGQFLKFVLIGVANTLVDLAVTLLLNGLLGWYYVAKIVGYVCGIGNSYLWNTLWTFRRERRRDVREVFSFLGVNLVTLVISLLLMALLRGGFGITDAYLAQAFPGIPPWITGDRVCTVLSTGVCLIINFVLNKFFVFRRGRAAAAAEPDKAEEKKLAEGKPDGEA